MDLGHFDNLLETRTSCGAKASTNSCSYQRHRNIKHWRENDLFHGAPLDPLLRPDLREPVRPGAPGGRQVVHVHRMVQGACRLVRGMRPELGRVVHLEIPLPGPGHFLSS